MAQDTPTPGNPRRLTRKPPESAEVRLARELLTTEYQARTTTGRTWQSLRTMMRALLNRLGRGSGGDLGGAGGFEGQGEPAPRWQQPDRQRTSTAVPNSPLGRLEAVIQSLDRPRREAFEDALLALVNQKNAKGDDSRWKKALDADLTSMPAVAHYASRAQARALDREAAAARSREQAPLLGSSALPTVLDANAVTAADAAAARNPEPAPQLSSSALPTLLDANAVTAADAAARNPEQAPQLSSSAIPTLLDANAVSTATATSEQSIRERFERGPLAETSAAPSRPVSPAPSTTSVSAAANLTPVSPMSAPASPVPPTSTPVPRAPSPRRRLTQ